MIVNLTWDDAFSLHGRNLTLYDATQKLLQFLNNYLRHFAFLAHFRSACCLHQQGDDADFRSCLVVNFVCGENDHIRVFL